MRVLRVLLLLALVAAPAPAVASRSVAVVLDTSRSMIENDPERYTLLVSQILADLLNDDDELTVVRMPLDGGVIGMLLGSHSCQAGVDWSLAQRLDPRDRAGFKRELDSLVSYDTGTIFAAPLRTALASLARSKRDARLLLIVADSGGLGECEAVLSRELSVARRSGTTIAAINLGGGPGAFRGNAAFATTLGARDSKELVEAVARIYQSFLGGKNLQSGAVHGRVAVTIEPHVREAFLLFAADGSLGDVRAGAGNPAAQSVDLDYRGGGSARGLDGAIREYRLVHLVRPQEGTWTFESSGLHRTAGWLLITDSSLGVRLHSSPKVPRGHASVVELRLVDEESGAAIPASVPGLTVTSKVDGLATTFRDDGTDGDRVAGDGIYSATVELDELGPEELAVRLTSDAVDRERAVALEVVEATWDLTVQTPETVPGDRPVELAVELGVLGAPAALDPPDRIDAEVAGETVSLLPQPTAERAAPPRYEGRWEDAEPGTHEVTYTPVGGSPASPATGTVEVAGVLDLGPPRPIHLGTVAAGGEARGELDLSGATIKGHFVVGLESSLDLASVGLEIDLGGGFVALDAGAVELPLTTDGPRRWPLRVRAGECPEACPPGAGHELVVAEKEGTARVAFPLELTVVPERWWICHWPWLVLLAALLLAAVVVHGYWSPARFAPRLGLLLSPEADLNEGFFHPIRGTRGTGSGFYRDAVVYVCQDFRLSAKGGDALARLQATRHQPRIRPVAGHVLWRQNVEGEWEVVPPEGAPVRLGTPYRNDASSLFFEVRFG